LSGNIAVDAACLLFTGYTVLCHAVAWSRGNAVDLLVSISVFLVVLMLLVFTGLRRKGRGWLAGLFVDEVACLPGDPVGSLARQRLVMGLIALGILALSYVSKNRLVFWGTSLVYFVAAWLMVMKNPVAPGGSCQTDDAGQAGRGSGSSRRFPGPGRQTLLLWALSLASVVLTLCARKHSGDDYLYLSFAVATADFPSNPVLGFDAVYGLGLPLQSPFYRVHTIEVLAGLVSYLTGLQAITVCHLVVPAIAAFLMPLALTRLFRLLDPGRWLPLVVVVILVYALDGTTTLGFTNHGLVRMYQGKAILLSVALPLIAAHGLRFALAPCWKNFVFLTASQIAGIGLNVTDQDFRRGTWSEISDYADSKPRR
jgi:hypothetical protein